MRWFRQNLFGCLGALCLFMSCGALASMSAAPGNVYLLIFFGMLTVLFGLWNNRERRNRQYAIEREHRRQDAIEAARIIAGQKANE
jgi:hypothetical protein